MVNQDIDLLSKDAFDFFSVFVNAACKIMKFINFLIQMI